MNIIDEILKESRYKKESQADQLPIFTDTVLKSKLYNVANQHSKGFFTDNSWSAVHNVQRALGDVLPTLTLYDSKYDNGFPPKYKEWSLVGAFITPKDVKRAVWIHITASGSGKIEDPLERYDVTVVITVLSPKNVDSKAREVLQNIGVV